MFIEKYSLLYSKDLELKNYSPNTIKNYKSQVELFLKDHSSVANKPSEINETQIKEWLLKTNTINSRKHKLSALKLFYKLTIKQPFKFKNIEYPRSEKKLPKIIEKDFLIKKIGLIDNLKHKSIIMLAFSTGIRVSEVCNLLISDIDSKRMIITIRQSKGRKDRIVPLSENVLKTLREYFKQYSPKEYLFNGQFDLKYSHKSCNEIVKKYIGKDCHFHLLRHSALTSLLESGTDISLIQKIAGHENINTTRIYCHVSTALLSKVNLPI